MVRTIDRYVIREVVPPFLLSLLILTFLLVLPPVMEHLEKLLAKGVSWTTAARIIWTAVPQAAGLTIPMSLLVGILVGLGRLSADREVVALLACGVSPYRLLRPIGLLGLGAAAATLYVMLVSIPDANQTFRELTFEVISKRIESDIHPRVFFQDFPGWVLYARDEPDPGTVGWKELFVTRTDESSGTRTVYLAKRGRMVIDRAQRQVHMVLEDGNEYSIAKQGQADTFRFPGSLVLTLNPDAVFQTINIQRGPNEKTIAELRLDMQDKIRNGISPHPEIITVQQKFSIPVACLVFALVGLALGMSVARDGKLAGFVVGIAVIFAYYLVFLLAESLTKGYYANPAAVKAGGRFLAAHLARWVPNIALGLFGIGALMWRARYTEGGLPLRLPDALRRRLDAWRQRRASRKALPGKPGRPTGTASRGRPIVVIRIPNLHVPMPRLIDRYISRIYLRIVGLSFLALLGLFYISTFIDKSEKIFKGQATTSTVATLLVYMTPQFVYYIIPIAALLSVLGTFGLLSRSSELTVMKACGVSLYRAALSVVLLSLAFSAVLFGLEQRVLARANRHADVLDAQIRGRAPRLFDIMNRQWIVGHEGSVYHYTYYNPERDEMSGLLIYRPDQKSWTLSSATFAERVTWNHGWQAASGWAQDFKSNPPVWTPFSSRTLDGIESPDYFKTEQPVADMMTVEQLWRYVGDLANSGANVVPLQVDLHKKLAFPLVTFVMTLLAVPFGVSAGRRGTLYGIGLGIAIALTYWIVISAFVAVGKGGLLSPVLAGWAPNILGTSVASYLFLTART
jgi:LPS export ABC transporter permease LptG/LPS export ABC transporter permease LptF